MDRMSLIADPPSFRARIAALPVVSYEIGETVIAGKEIGKAAGDKEGGWKS